MIVIVDYGVGDLGSVKNMLKKAGTEVKISDSKNDIMMADKVILPGVGHFDYGMQMLQKSGLRDTLDEYALNLRRPILGICLGPSCLAWIVKRVKKGVGLDKHELLEVSFKSKV